MSYIPTHSKELFHEMASYYQVHNSCSEEEALDQVAIANLYPNWDELMKQYDDDKAIYDFIMEYLVNDQVRCNEDKINHTRKLERLKIENKLSKYCPIIKHRVKISSHDVAMVIDDVYNENEKYFLSVMHHEMRLSSDNTDNSINAMTKFAQKIADKAMEVLKNKEHM